jgi:hypothetical protein
VQKIPPKNVKYLRGKLFLLLDHSEDFFSVSNGISEILLEKMVILVTTEFYLTNYRYLYNIQIKRLFGKFSDEFIDLFEKSWQIGPVFLKIGYPNYHQYFSVPRKTLTQPFDLYRPA